MNPVLSVWVVEAISIGCVLMLGFFCAAGNGSLIKMMMGINVMARAVCLTLLIAGIHQGKLALAQSMMITIIMVDAAVTTLGMAMLVNVYRHYGSIEADKLTRLHGRV